MGDTVIHYASSRGSARDEPRSFYYYYYYYYYYLLLQLRLRGGPRRGDS